MLGIIQVRVYRTKCPDLLKWYKVRISNDYNFLKKNYIWEGFVVDIRFVSSVGYDLFSTGVDSSTTQIWNGTGINDFHGDWSRGGYGVESSDAAYSGTNGLSATEFTSGRYIQFTSSVSLDVSGFDLLVFRLNIKSWDTDGDITISFSDGNTASLRDYIDIDAKNSWQRIIIPLTLLELNEEIDHLLFTSTGSHSIYLDDILLSIGVCTYVYVPVTAPVMT